MIDAWGLDDCPTDTDPALGKQAERRFSKGLCLPSFTQTHRSIDRCPQLTHTLAGRGERGGRQGHPNSEAAKAGCNRKRQRRGAEDEGCDGAIDVDWIAGLFSLLKEGRALAVMPGSTRSTRTGLIRSTLSLTHAGQGRAAEVQGKERGRSHNKKGPTESRRFPCVRIRLNRAAAAASKPKGAGKCLHRSQTDGKLDCWWSESTDRSIDRFGS
jgi:hypothetical protein